MNVNDNALRLLRMGRRRIEQGWCQGDWARDANGEPTPPWDETAVSWCATGAALTEDCNDDDSGWWEALTQLKNVLIEQARGNDVPRWNDTKGRTRKEVLEVYDRAIDRQMLICEGGTA